MSQYTSLGKKGKFTFRSVNTKENLEKVGKSWSVGCRSHHHDSIYLSINCTVHNSWLTCLHIPSPLLDPKGALVDKAWVNYQAEVSLNATPASMINVKKKKKKKKKRKKERLIANMLSGTYNGYLETKKASPPPLLQVYAATVLNLSRKFMNTKGCHISLHSSSE